jgi:hypothetical protein
MKQCKTCIHEKVCEKSKHIENYRIGDCENYKDETRFIELPCKVGDAVYVIYNNKVIKGKTISLEIVIEKDNISFIAGVNFFCSISMNKGFTFGNNVFLTKEEAEKALKEKQR